MTARDPETNGAASGASRSTCGGRPITGTQPETGGYPDRGPSGRPAAGAVNGWEDGPVLLVTGATGYLGSAVVALAVRRGQRVRAAVRDPARAALLPDEVELVAADLDDAASLERAVRGCAAVLHVAGIVSDSLARTRAGNVEGTRRMLAASVAAGVSRFVYTSSSAAILTADGVVAEQPSGLPALTDAYSVSKAEAEALVLGTGAIEAMTVNPVNIYGPSPRGPRSYNGLFVAAARGEVDAVVDAPVGWVLAEDAALGHLLALERGEPGRRYVLCGEVAGFGRVLHTFADLVGGTRVATAPPGSSLGEGAGTFARRSEVYGRLPPVRVDDRGARALGLAARGVDEGLALTASWIGSPAPAPASARPHSQP